MRIVDIVDPTVRVELDAKQNRGENRSRGYYEQGKTEDRLRL